MTPDPLPIELAQDEDSNNKHKSTQQFGNKDVLLYNILSSPTTICGALYTCEVYDSHLSLLRGHVHKMIGT